MSDKYREFRKVLNTLPPESFFTFPSIPEEEVAIRRERFNKLEELMQLLEPEFVGGAYRYGELLDLAIEKIITAHYDAPLPGMMPAARMIALKAETDYRTLLQKYINYVRDVEGVDYITANEQRYASDVEFSEAEWNALEQVASLAVEEE